jgi:hypothetical protein
MTSRSLLVLAALCLLPTSAVAATFPIADPAGGLHLDVYTWDGRPCIAAPPQTDRTACLPSDPLMVSPMADHVEVLTSAVVHFDGWDMAVLATRVDARTVTLDGIEPDDVLRLAKQAVPLALPRAARLVSDGIDAQTQVRPSGGVPTVRLTPAIEAGPGGAQRPAVVEYVLCAAHGVYEIAFLADAAHAADVAKVADNALATMVAIPPVRAGKNVFNLLGYWAGRAAVLALVGALAFFRWRSARERARQRGAVV